MGLFSHYTDKPKWMWTDTSLNYAVPEIISVFFFSSLRSTNRIQEMACYTGKKKDKDNDT